MKNTRGFNDDQTKVNTNVAAQAAQRYQLFHEFVSSGQLRTSVIAAAQATIDGRVQDLARVLGDASGMTEEQEERARFVQDLQKIVCTPRLPGQAQEQELRNEDVDALITTFSEVTKREFDQGQRDLLTAGIRALVQINANAETRHDLSLIQRNIALFLDNVQTVFSRNFDVGQRRLLTRALVRLVGDGSQS